MIGKIDHIGIAVRSLDETIPFYEKTLGLKCQRRERVESQRVFTAFLDVGDSHLELLEPTDQESTIAKFLESNGEGIHHVAFGTDDIQGQLDQAARTGCRLIHEKPFEGAGQKWVAFLHPKSTHGALMELCMPKRP